MDKKQFINSINVEDKTLLSSIYDKMYLCEKTGKTVFGNDFYPPIIWSKIINISKEFDFNVFSFGIFDEAERRILAFSDAEVYDYPIKLLKITYNSKFSKLEHRDFLGALMSIGIKREKFGDIIVKDDSCYIASFSDICDTIENSLTSIGKCSCKVEILDYDVSDIPKTQFQEMTINTNSLRLDCICASICNISRSKADDIIASGKALVNYSEAKEKDKHIEPQSIITFRGYGKYKLDKIIGETQRGRIKVVIKKYI
jgi:RNA-binding protein YlmH